VPRHWAGDKENVGMARRGHELDAEAFNVIERVVEGVDLELATIARPGIHLPDRQAAGESPLDDLLDLGTEDIHRNIAARLDVFSDDTNSEGLAEQF
jgi:hypothetical protein